MTLQGLPRPDLVSRDLLGRTAQFSAPINPLGVVGLWPKLRVTQTTLDGDAYFVSFGPLGGEILVADDRDVTRQRFSIAHELGHWILEHQYGVERPPTSQRDRHVEIERWCDQFAASLLMPADWIKDEMRDCEAQQLFRRLDVMAKRYGVSHTALRLRVPEVTPISILLMRYDGTDWALERAQWSAESQGQGEIAAGALTAECFGAKGPVYLAGFAAITERVGPSDPPRAFLGLLPQERDRGLAGLETRCGDDASSFARNAAGAAARLPATVSVSN